MTDYWTKIGLDIDGEAPYDYSGQSVSISADGLTVAIGAPNNDGNGYNSGQVRVYGLLPPPPIPICFPKGTPVTTDQGSIAIDKLNCDKHTIRGKQIVAITKTRPFQKHIVSIQQNAMGKNVPSATTQISKEHKVFFKGEMRKAKDLVGLCENVFFIPYNGEALYNVLLMKHDKMMINNLICETLNPTNIMAKIINSNSSSSEKKKIYSELTDIIKKNNIPAYKKLYNSVN